MLRAAICLVTLLLSSSAHASVWETTQRWDSSWEQRYAAWVASPSGWRVDIFQDSASPLKGLFPDCADAVYSMRAIFASQNGLPFAVTDPTTQRTVLTNEMHKFDQVPAGGPRLKAFLKWIYGMLGTPNLPSDTYPTAITRAAVHAGGLMLASESKHSYTIKNILETGVPTLYYSTQANRGNLKARSWPSVSFLFSKGIHEPSGFRYFRQPEDLLKPVWEVPGYSTEQYEAKASQWVRTMQSKLARRQETANEALKRILNDACQLATTRIDLVNEALAQMAQIGGRCFNANEFDDYSTPSRDGQTSASFVDLANAWALAQASQETIDPDLLTTVQSVFASQEDGKSAFCAIQYTAGKSMSLGELRRRLSTGAISSNPNDPIAVRWGDQVGPSAHARHCPVY